MRKLATVGALVIGLATSPARADEVDDLVVSGEASAKAGEWSQAIVAFKAADARRPRALHACLIGLAYTRRELWPQAEVFLALCRQRATPEDPAPAWVADAEQTLATKLAASNAVAVTVAVTPPEAAAQVAISSFAPDETFAPRTIHLAPGTYTFTATAPGYEPATRNVVVESGAKEAQVELALRSTAAVVVTAPAPAATASPVPRYLMIAGGAVILAGVGVHAFVLGPAHGDLDDATTNAAYDAGIDTYRRRRTLTLGFYAGGAAIALTGLVLRYTVFRAEAPVQISGSIGHDHGMVTLGWQR